MINTQAQIDTSTQTIFDRAASTVRTTNNYSKFTLYQVNRDVSRTKKLEISMLAYGFCHSFPIVCTRENDGTLVIKSGHHRFNVARKLNLPISYVICNESDLPDIHEIEASTNYWNMQDHLVSNVRCGKTDYQIVEEFHQKTGIPLGSCVSLLCGQIAGTGNFSERFKKGEFTVRNRDFAESVGCIVIFLKEKGVKFAAVANFVSSISKCVLTDVFDIELFKQKSAKKLNLFVKQSTSDQYLQMIDIIYNHASKTKIPLKFLVEENSKSRSAIAMTPKK